MKFEFNVIQTVEVELDESLYTEEFLQAFSEVMWEVDDVKEVAEYIARNTALFGEFPIEFVPKGGHTAKVVDEYVEEV
jgi:hypothetical protein